MEERGKGLDESLSRARSALTPPASPPSHEPSALATTLGILAAFLLVWGFASGHHWIIPIALLLAAAGGAAFVARAAPAFAAKLQGGPISADRPHIGAGASIGTGAVVEPGASVEMGAVVGKGAVIRSGAVVRMGATVSRGARIEAGALVSWGAVVKRDAVVGERAVVGAGSVVRRDARVPSGMRLRPGSVYGGQGDSGLLTPAPLAPAPPPKASIDPRLAAVCDKLDAELRSSPERVRSFLGGSERTLASLRQTCEDLAGREQAMRAEVDPAALARLDEERAALASRLAAEPDAQIRGSLQGAVTAIDEARRQREVVRLGADRLQAERTRLLYTLEALASQFARLRSAGAEAARAPDGELERGVRQLRSELDAIAEALEQVAQGTPARMDAALASPPPDAPENAGGSDPRARTR